MPHSDPIPDDLPTATRLVVLGYDAELDELHPGWRHREPFPHLDYAPLARVKWLLKRRELLLFRKDGRPAPRDWTVKVIPDPRNPRRCFVVPEDPSTVAPVERVITTEPARVLA